MERNVTSTNFNSLMMTNVDFEAKLHGPNSMRLKEQKSQYLNPPKKLFAYIICKRMGKKCLLASEQRDQSISSNKYLHQLLLFHSIDHWNDPP